MKDYQSRVVEERSELDKKIDALEHFIAGAIYKKLDDEEQTRLRRQLTIMKAYQEILAERVKNFK